MAGKYSAERKFKLALAQIRQEFSEEKLAGILFLQEILIAQGGVDCSDCLREFADMFSGSWIQGPGVRPQKEYLYRDD